MWFGNKGQRPKIDSIHNPIGGRLRPYEEPKHHQPQETVTIMHEVVVNICLNCTRPKCSGCCEKVMNAQFKLSNKNMAHPRKGSLHEFHGETLSIRQIAERLQVHPDTIRKRMRNTGRSAEWVADKILASQAPEKDRE